MSGPERVGTSAELGRADKPRDLLLGWAAFAPLPALAAAAWALPSQPLILATLVCWAGGLLCFFSGVRRGLSFSERKGAGVGEVAGFLLLFFVGVVGLTLRQPWVLAAGFVLAGWQDRRAARRGEAPRYFAPLRPAQAAVAALSLLAAAARPLSG